MVDISKLKVFKFENGEEECIIAKDYKEAYNYYKDMIGEEIEECNITEIKDWFEIKVKCEAMEKQEDGTYFKMETMAEMANEFYSNSYTGAELISTTVVY